MKKLCDKLNCTRSDTKLLEEFGKGLEVCELVDGAQFRDPFLVDEASDSDHGKAPVLDLIALVLLECSRFLAEAERVEAKVTWCALSFDSSLQGVHRDELECRDEEENLTHAAGLDVEVMSVDGQHVREVGASECELFLDKESQHGKHTNTIMSKKVWEIEVRIQGYT